MKFFFSVSVLFLFSYQSLIASKHDEIIDSLHSVLERSVTDSAKIMALNEIAWKYVYNDFDSAKTYFRKAVLVANKSESDYAQAYTNLRIGSFYAIYGNYTGALNAFLSCLYISENNDFTQLIPKVWNNLGNLYYHLSDHERSIVYYKKSLERDRNNPNKSNFTNTLTNIGGPYSKLGHYDSALLYLEQAEVIAKEENLNLALIYHNHGRLLSHSEKFDDALVYYRKSLVEKEKAGLDGRKVNTYIQIGDIYQKLNNVDSAEYYYTKAHDIALKFNQYSYELEVAKNLSKIMADRGDFEGAYKFNQRAISLVDSIQNSPNTKEIESREFYYNIEIDKLKEDLKVQKAELMQFIIITLSILVLAVIGLMALAFIMYHRKKNSNVLLTKKVEEKTLELERKNNILERHAFELSHIIKAPITSILGIINLLDYEQKVEEQTECLSKLKGISKNLDSVLSDTTKSIGQN